ncbi:hypothetical protein ACROYT_G016963 [Oculina patagonica]
MRTRFLSPAAGQGKGRPWGRGWSKGKTPGGRYAAHRQKHIKVYLEFKKIIHRQNVWKIEAGENLPISSWTSLNIKAMMPS